MRFLVIAAFVLGCKSDAPAPATGSAGSITGSGTAAGLGSADKPAGSAVAKGPCGPSDLLRASKVMDQSGHPCRARISHAYGRLARVGLGYSGTIVTTDAARGAGLLVTCQHCAGATDAVLTDPERDPPSTIHVFPPAMYVDSKLRSGSDDTKFYFAHRLFAPVPPKSAFDKRGGLTQIRPVDDFTLATISGALVTVVGHLGAIAPAKVSDTALPVLADPRKLARSKAPFLDARPGSLALVLGFPQQDHDGELVASFGPVLDDAAARDLLARSDPDEAAIAYDPKVEMIVAARGVSGMSGGGVFDETGRFVGVAVRATTKPVDGKYLIRVVRATHIAAKLSEALKTAPLPLRTQIVKFLP